MKNKDYPRKVRYSDYVQGFSDDLLKKFEEGWRNLNEFDTETMRGLIYGYTFTEDYAKGIIPDGLSMDYWRGKDTNSTYFNRPKHIAKNITKHNTEMQSSLSLNEMIGRSGLIRDAILSTGDGTIDHPYCVICVEHEYEIFRGMTIKRQYLLPGYIDCFECEEVEWGIPHVIYFDISRWFEKVKLI